MKRFLAGIIALNLITLPAVPAENPAAAKPALETTMKTNAPDVTAITEKMAGDCMTTLGLKYDLARARIMPAKASEGNKQLHGKNQWTAEGNVAADAQGLLLKGTAKEAWASPELWSGLKNVTVTVKMKIEAAPEGAAFGVKFGHVWAIGAAGPRLMLNPGAGTVAFIPAAGENKPVAEARVKIPLNEWFIFTATYSYDGELCEAALNGRSILKVAMPREPFDAFMQKFGRPAPLAGLGVVAAGGDLRVAEFSFLAGAPKRRIVILGDSITQRAYWVAELEKALGEKITNLGIGGDNVKMGSFRFGRDVLPLQPEICVIFEGSNDLGGRSPQGVADFIQTMVKQCKQAGIRPVVCEILPRRGIKIVPDYNVEIRKIAEANGAPLLAWYAATLDPEKGEMKPGYAPDGTHPVQPGGEAMIKAITLEAFKK